MIPRETRAWKTIWPYGFSCHACHPLAIRADTGSTATTGSASRGGSEGWNDWVNDCWFMWDGHVGIKNIWTCANDAPRIFLLILVYFGQSYCNIHVACLVLPCFTIWAWLRSPQACIEPTDCKSWCWPARIWCPPESIWCCYHSACGAGILKSWKTIKASTAMIVCKGYPCQHNVFLGRKKAPSDLFGLHWNE